MKQAIILLGIWGAMGYVIGLADIVVTTLGGNLTMASATDIEAGSQLFQQRCALCHGPDGKAEPPAAAALLPKPRDLTNGIYMNQVSDAYLATIIMQGGPAVGLSPIMPPQADLDEEQVQDIIAFVRDLAVPQYMGIIRVMPDFVAQIDGTQVINPDGSTGTGSNGTGIGYFWFNMTKSVLDYRIELVGLDVDGFVTKSITTDDVTNIHIHVAVAGTNGLNTLNIYKEPCEDDHDLLVQPFRGHISGGWDDNDMTDLTNCSELVDKPEIQSKPLSVMLDALCMGGLYIDIHTTAFPNGEIRGQIMPAAGACEDITANLAGSRQ